MSDNVVSLSPPEGAPDIVADFRLCLSEAMNARIISYVTVRIDQNGNVKSSYYFDNPAHQLALGTVVDIERMNETAI